MKKSQNESIDNLLTDSRRLIFPESSLFFALPGDRRDGHDYIPELYERGVRNFVISQKIGLADFTEANFLLVKNSLDALQALAAFHRRQFEIPVIGISGSNGKTIVKEWLNQLLEDSYDIVRSPKSYNSQIGVPLSVWQISANHELGLFEAGISRPGEMKKLEAIIQPNTGIFTNIGEAHREGFKHPGKKIREKLVLFKNSKALIYCKDHDALDKEIMDWSKNRSISLFSWGKNKQAWLHIRSLKKSAGNTKINLTVKRKRHEIEIPFTDQASLENVLTCVCTLLQMGIDLETISHKLYKLTPVAMRLELQTGINHCSIINDSYSADLSSLGIALDFLAQQQQHSRKTLILSDILESGMDEKKLYREIARLLHQKKVNRLIAIGRRISANRTAFEQTLKGELWFFADTDQFISNIQQLGFRDETILIKGARVFQFEKIDHLLAQQAHQTVLEINLSSMVHNLKQYQQLIRPSTKIMAMVKAFAYGTGSFEIANVLQFHKVDYLAVAYADEGIELRKAGIRMPIMVMNAEEEGLDGLLQYNLEPVIYSIRILNAMDAYLKKEGLRQFPVHIEIETGMNRLGISVADLPELVRRLQTDSFKVQSVFSHLAASEEKQQDEFTRNQADLFLATAARIQESLNYPFLRHIANSAAIIRYPDLQLDMVRLGIGLYGIDSAESHRLDLQEIAVLKSTIAQIKHLKPNETVGYNRKGIAVGNMIIATVRIGYADGYPRSLGDGAGKMLVRGRLAPTVGSICMDMTMIDITHIPESGEGEEVIVFGSGLPVSQLSHWARTIPYEMLTGISQRVKRVYYEE